MISPKPVSKIVQAKIVTNREEPLDEDKDYFKRKHKPNMPQIIPTEKPYQDWRGRPSPIGNASRSPISGWIVPINNGNGGPFGKGGNGPPWGGGVVRQEVVVMILQEVAVVNTQ